MKKPILIIRKKMIFTEVEKDAILLGTVSEKQTETYKKAKKYFEEYKQFYFRIGALSTIETKIWFDFQPNLNSLNLPEIKMQFIFDSIDHEKYERFSKKTDQVFKEMSDEMNIAFKDLSEKMNKIFADMKPVMDKAFSNFDDIFTDFFGESKSKKKK
jgi:hypothetical protein